MKTRKLSVAFFCPMYSASRVGRKDNSNCRSSSIITALRTLAGASSSDMRIEGSRQSAVGSEDRTCLYCSLLSAFRLLHFHPFDKLRRLRRSRSEEHTSELQSLAYLLS